MAQTDSRYWKRHARRYDHATLILNRRFGAMADRVAESIRGAPRVLEIAAGTGLVTARIAHAVEVLVATDRSPEMLAILRHGKPSPSAAGSRASARRGSKGTHFDWTSRRTDLLSR